MKIHFARIDGIVLYSSSEPLKNESSTCSFTVYACISYGTICRIPAMFRLEPFPPEFRNPQIGSSDVMRSRSTTVDPPDQGKAPYP